MTIFDKIILGEIPSYKIAESDDYFAFLDIFPITKGHTLVVPKKNATNKIFDLSKENYLGLMDFAYTVAAGIEKTIPCNRVGVAVLGLEVPHAHVHLIPIHNETDLSFSKPKLKLSQEEFLAIQKMISDSI